MARLFFALLSAASIAVSVAHAAVLDCELNGQSVNPANGSTTAGKTGIMKCVERETRKFSREEEYRDGKAMGYRKSVDFSGNVSVGHYNEQGNRHGEFKNYAPDGTLVSEERYSNSNLIGAQIYYHPNKQVRRRSFAEPPRGRSPASSTTTGASFRSCVARTSRSSARIARSAGSRARFPRSRSTTQKVMSPVRRVTKTANASQSPLTAGKARLRRARK